MLSLRPSPWEFLFEAGHATVRLTAAQREGMSLATMRRFLLLAGLLAALTILSGFLLKALPSTQYYVLTDASSGPQFSSAVAKALPIKERADGFSPAYNTPAGNGPIFLFLLICFYVTASWSLLDTALRAR
jgi:hypothetical protein